jgi:hypothetical protein
MAEVEARSGNEIDGTSHLARPLHWSADARGEATPMGDFGFISIICSLAKRLEKGVGAIVIAVYLELSFESAIQLGGARPCCRRGCARIAESFINV